MTTINITAIRNASGVTHCIPAFAYTGGSTNVHGTPIRYAPFTFVDSGTPLNMTAEITTNQAVTAGNKYSVSPGVYSTYYGMMYGRYYYWECTQSGTTGSTTLTTEGVSLGAGGEMTYGTAKFRKRMYHGWSRARNTIDSAAGRNSDGNSHHASWVVFVASTHVEPTQYGVTIALDDEYYYYNNTSIFGAVGHTLISVSKAQAIPTTFSAGASCLFHVSDTRFSYQSLPTAERPAGAGFVRGVTWGSANEIATERFWEEVYMDWGYKVRYFDCRFVSYQDHVVSPYSWGPGLTTNFYGYAHCGARHSVRCSYESLHSTNPQAVIGTGGENTSTVFGVYESPTFVMANNGTAPTVGIKNW